MVDLVENLFTVVERVSVAKLSKMRTTRSDCLVLMFSAACPLRYQCWGCWGCLIMKKINKKNTLRYSIVNISFPTTKRLAHIYIREGFTRQ